MKNLPNFFVLSLKEENAMKVLWESDKPMGASEIAEKIPGCQWPASSIQNVIRSLEKKGIIEVAGLTQFTKGYGRLFRPAITIDEYISMQLHRYYSADKESLPLVTALIGKNKSREDIAETLQELLNNYKNKE